MKSAFAGEDARKDKLFCGWIEYLQVVHSQHEDKNFQEFYEGMATVSDLSKNRLDLHLEDGRKLRHIPVTSEISLHSRRLDSMYVVLGLFKGAWWPLDVISIGNIISLEKGQVHITYNPIYVNGGSRVDVPMH